MSKFNIDPTGHLSVEEAVVTLSKEIAAGSIQFAKSVGRTGAFEEGTEAFWEIYYEMSWFLMHFVTRFACFTLEERKQPKFIRTLFEATFPTLVAQEAEKRLELQDLFYLRFTKLPSVRFRTVFSIEEGESFLEKFENRNEVYYRHDIVFDERDPDYAKSLLPLFVSSIVDKSASLSNRSVKNADWQRKSLERELLEIIHNFELPEMFSLMS